MTRAKKRAVGRPSKGAEANVLPVRSKLKKEEVRILEERIKAGEGKTPAEVIRKDIERGNREFRRKRARKSKRH